MFTWRVARGHSKAGATAGAVRPDGYVSIVIDYRPHRAHRLAFLYMTGEIPQHEVDHEDRDPSNNRWLNLRPSTPGQNKYNTGVKSNNSSGHKGVSWSNRTQTWRGYVSFAYKQYHAGYFKSLRECVEAVERLRVSLHGEFANHGLVCAS